MRDQLSAKSLEYVSEGERNSECAQERHSRQQRCSIQTEEFGLHKGGGKYQINTENPHKKEKHRAV